MTKVKFTPRAIHDLDVIWSHIAIKSLAYADKTRGDLLERISLLGAMPQLGRDASDLGSGMRCLVIGMYLVYYTLSDETISVVRVLHGNRHITRRMFRPSGMEEV